MKTQPKYKVCRRLGPGVYEKCQTDKYVLRESRGKGQKGQRGRPPRRRSRSEFNRQLLEKQKVRLTYGVSERQFSRYVNEAIKSRGVDTSTRLYELLESRLDNVVFRLGLAPTRRAARQLVAHGHVLVNGRRVKVPSHSVRKGDHVSVRDGSRDKAVFQNRAEALKEHQSPAWLAYNVQTYDGEVCGSPDTNSIEGLYDLNAVIEFYSR